jgi:glyoxylase I family protein
MPQPEGAELEAVRARRAELKAKYLRPVGERPATPVRGVHHIALVARDVEATVRFDLGNRNLLGFFDFPGHPHQDYIETIGAVQHLALSVDADHFAAIKAKLDAEGVDYLGPDRGADDSLYVKDPNGVGLEFYQEELGIFAGQSLHLDGTAG